MGGDNEPDSAGVGQAGPGDAVTVWTIELHTTLGFASSRQQTNGHKASGSPVAVQPPAAVPLSSRAALWIRGLWLHKYLVLSLKW